MSMPKITAIQSHPSMFPSQWELTTVKKKTVYVRYRKGVLQCSYFPLKETETTSFFSKKLGTVHNNSMSTETMLSQTGFDLCIRRGVDADL